MSETTTRRRMSSDYLLPDGSPRYGIRTEEAVAQAPAAPAKALASEDIIRKAEQFNVVQLHTAASYANYLRESDGDPFLEGLKEEHLVVLAESRAVVEERLGTNKRWLKEARRLRMEDELPTGDMPTQRELKMALQSVQVLILSLVLFLAPIAVVFYLLMVRTQLEVVLPAYVVLAFCANYLMKRQKHRLPLVAAPLGVDQVESLKQTVTDAVFIGTLREKGVEVDPVAAKAGLRRWEHLCFIAAKVDEMRSYSRR